MLPTPWPIHARAWGGPANAAVATSATAAALAAPSRQRTLGEGTGIAVV
jgi:hypothetical protein